MTVCASHWGTYELDSSWSDQSTHIFVRDAGSRTHTLVIHRDLEGAGMTADAYAERQHGVLARTLPDFTSIPAPALPHGRAWAYSWRTPKGPIAQIQAVLPHPEAAVVFTLTGIPDIEDHARGQFIRTVLSARLNGG